jgi:hypothetical protein
MTSFRAESSFVMPKPDAKRQRGRLTFDTVPDANFAEIGSCRMTLR